MLNYFLNFVLGTLKIISLYVKILFEVLKPTLGILNF